MEWIPDEAGACVLPFEVVAELGATEHAMSDCIEVATIAHGSRNNTSAERHPPKPSPRVTELGKTLAYGGKRRRTREFGVAQLRLAAPREVLEVARALGRVLPDREERQLHVTELLFSIGLGWERVAALVHATGGEGPAQTAFEMFYLAKTSRPRMSC